MFNGIQTTICRPGHEIGAPAVPEPVEPAMQGRSLRFLLAEDNVVNKRLAVRLLEKAGHSVVVASNGREAVLTKQSSWNGRCGRFLPRRASPFLTKRYEPVFIGLAVVNIASAGYLQRS
jgi:hypothetical protein